ncbi:TonB-dependent receptor [Sphingomonas sp. PvP018]|uniref:TonB-dependent receptor n=1 Tax=Sphingomonas sp. PvP018 TaxID=2817852 RepID=UPI001AE0F22D|nr:TonB-dependent receptor [Sphingomonas sp. PvP018]MBP2513804.1 outer membrane receptor protein involved in Fe transport [Sphingomonas sp. PvP018]
MVELLLAAMLVGHPQDGPPDATPNVEPNVERPEIMVTARTRRPVGVARAASEGTVDGEDLRRRPLLRTSELAEAVPGLIAVQHSGGGKAAQYLIRGYNLDHGTDFSIAIDGMPFNLRSHAHGQGYLDLNGLIPETVDRIAYRKGPYRAADGDFSFVAAASLDTLDRFARPFASMTAGSYGYRRLAAGGSGALGAGTLLLATEVKANDGPWALPEDLRHVGAFGKYTVDTGMGVLRASLSLYDARWRPTEQIPVRAIGTVVPDRFGTLDPFLRGRTDRQVLNIGLTGGRTTLTAYAQHYRFALLSNFTFFLDDPVDGDELEQSEDRWTYGARVSRRFDLADDVGLTAGIDSQIDVIGDLGLYRTRFGRRIATRSLVDVQETSVSGHAELTWRPTPRLNLLAGARLDHFRFRTSARAGSAVSGGVSDTIATPKAGANLELVDGLALYANYGQGFHSNAVRGVISAVDATPGVSRATGYEIGTRFERGPLVLSIDHWWSRASSELVYSGDDGTVSPTGPSRRRGIEVTASVKALHWLAIDAVYATNHARFVDAPGADRIPNALEAAGELGIAATFGSFDAALRVRYLGPRALTEDDRVRSPATTVVNLRTARRFGAIELNAELLNLFDTARADADYFYASRLPGEPAEGVEGVHSRTVEPRMLRIGATIGF